MTDLEEQLGAVFVAVADDAPLGSDLADAARRRHRARRHRRVGLAAAAVVAVVGASGVVWAIGGGTDGSQKVAQDPTTTSTTQAAPGWRTVEYDGVELTVLPTWVEKDCGGGLVQFSPGAQCQTSHRSEGAWFVREGSVESIIAEGELVETSYLGMVDVLWVGFKGSGDYAVFVTHPDKETAQRLLNLIH